MFSVIIPAYNAAPYIYMSIKSVLDQTINDFEIVVVDDGSIDDTSKVVQSINDHRIRYIYQSNAGVSAARNTGIRSAKGEYICFLDADDLWKCNHLEEIAHLIIKYPSAGVFLTGHEIRLHNGTSLTRVCPCVDADLQIDNMFEYIFRYGYFFHTNSIVCKLEVFETVGLFEVGVKIAEDNDMWYRLFAFYSVAVSKNVTTIYIRENSRATSTRVYVDDWVFLYRVNGIMDSMKVSQEKKASLLRLLEQRKLSLVRHLILKGEKKNAWKQMKAIDRRLVKKKKYIETLVAFMFPSALSMYLVTKRDRNYYGS